MQTQIPSSFDERAVFMENEKISLEVVSPV